MNTPTKLAELQLGSQLPLHSPFRAPKYPCPRSSSDSRRPISDHEDRRGSAGSDCSMPGMVEDHGSDISTEDDYQYHATDTELWDSFWQTRADEAARERVQYPALLDTYRPRHQLPVAMVNQELQHMPRDQAGSQSIQQGLSWPLPQPNSSVKQHEKTTPRASYSLFPSKTDIPPVQALGFPRRPSVTEQPGDRDSQSSGSSSNTRRPSVDAVLNNPADPAQVASYMRRPLPATPKPATPRGTVSGISPLDMKPLPKTPDQEQDSPPRSSMTRRRKGSISKTPTRSSPSLSVQHQTIIPLDKELRSYRSQALRVPSTLPEEPPSPPQISVFELDDTPGLARRFVRGLVPRSPRWDRNGSKETAGHQRSASHSPSTPTSTRSKAAWPRRERAGTTGAVGLGDRGRSDMSSGESSEESPLCGQPVKQSRSSFLVRILGRRGSAS